MSPSERLFVTQIGLEPLLRARAEELGAETRFGTELVECEQDADGVTSVIRDRASGRTSTVRSRYLVAADGPRSPIRERLGISMEGRGVFSNAITIYFRADVEPLLRGRNLSVVLVMNDVFAGFFRIEKPYRSGFLVVHSVGDPTSPVTDVWDLDEQRCVDLVHAGLGDDTVAVTIEDVMRWQAMADVAERFQEGRIFLAGDAAHVMPPYGGYGGNTGIHDAHNLAWKLAAGARRRGSARASRHLRPGAPAGRASDCRAGVCAVRHAGGAVPGRGRDGIDRRRPRHRPRRAPALARDRRRRHRRRRRSTSTRASRARRRARARRTSGSSATANGSRPSISSERASSCSPARRPTAWARAGRRSGIAVHRIGGARLTRRSRRRLPRRPTGSRRPVPCSFVRRIRGVARERR